MDVGALPVYVAHARWPGMREPHKQDSPREIESFTQLSLLAYMLDHDLLARQDIVCGKLRIQDRSSRNLNYAVRSDRVAYFVKQATDRLGRETIASEASIYELVQTDPRFTRSRKHLPRLVHFDPGRAMLITSHLGEGRSLTLHQARTGRFSARQARELALLLAQFHSITPQRSDAARSVGLWASGITRPTLEMVREASSANLQLLKTIQRYPEFAKGLAAVQDDWDNGSVVHGDVKWDNILISHDGQARRDWWILDWELGGAGDARWDVGCALAEYLRCWIMTAIISGSTDPASIPDRTRYPLIRLQRAMGAFCMGYGDQRNIDAAFFTDVPRFAAARLVQLAYEHTASNNALSSQAICLLQLSYNLLARPLECFVELFGARLWA